MQGFREDLQFALCAAAVGATSACSTVPGSVAQRIEVEAVTVLGAEVAGARCLLALGDAEWTLVAPGAATVMTSADDLVARCESPDGNLRGELRLPSRVQGSAGRGAVIGGSLGLALGYLVGSKDKHSGSDSYSYCCGDSSGAIGAAAGLGLGAAIGALSAAPRHSYASKVRVVLTPQGGSSQR